MVIVSMAFDVFDYIVSEAFWWFLFVVWHLLLVIRDMFTDVLFICSGTILLVMKQYSLFVLAGRGATLSRKAALRFFCEYF